MLGLGLDDHQKVHFKIVDPIRSKTVLYVNLSSYKCLSCGQAGDLNCIKIKRLFDSLKRMRVNKSKNSNILAIMLITLD
jgi:hypothetical protein